MRSTPGERCIAAYKYLHDMDQASGRACIASEYPVVGVFVYLRPPTTTSLISLINWPMNAAAHNGQGKQSRARAKHLTRQIHAKERGKERKKEKKKKKPAACLEGIPRENNNGILEEGHKEKEVVPVVVGRVQG